MHQVIVDGLENYLSGNPGREFRAHLAACPDCRQEVLQFEEVSALFQPLRPEPHSPAPGFAGRVVARVKEQQPVSLWNIFSFEPALPRRVAFASLLVLAVLGSLLVSQESAYNIAPGPEHLITQSVDDDEVPAHRERMLVTLTTYQP